MAANPLGCTTLPSGELLELRHKTKLTTRAVPGWMKPLIGFMCDLMPVRLGHGGCDHPLRSFQNNHMCIGHSYTNPTQPKGDAPRILKCGELESSCGFVYSLQCKTKIKISPFVIFSLNQINCIFFWNKYNKSVVACKFCLILWNNFFD